MSTVYALVRGNRSVQPIVHRVMKEEDVDLSTHRFLRIDPGSGSFKEYVPIEEYEMYQSIISKKLEQDKE